MKIEKIEFSLMCKDGKLFYFIGEKIKWEDRKYNFYKLIHVFLLKKKLHPIK